MSRDDDRDDPQPRRLIYEIRERVQFVRNQFWRESVQGYVTEATRRELAIAAVQYHDVLSEHDDEKAVKDRWDEAGVEWIREAVGSSVEVAIEAVGDTSAVRYEQRPAVTTLDPAQVVHVTKQLDRLAKRLGFGAATKDVTHHDEGTLEHLGELSKARGQATAMQHLKVDSDEESDGRTVVEG